MRYLSGSSCLNVEDTGEVSMSQVKKKTLNTLGNATDLGNHEIIRNKYQICQRNQR